MRLLDVVILALAAWRIASLLSSEEGPWDVFSRLRTWAGVRYDAQSEPYGANALARGMLCLWCCSVWAGAVLALAYWLWPGIVWLALPLALSAGAIVVQNVTNREVS